MGSELARATVKIVGDITDLEAALSLGQEAMDKAGKGFEEMGHTLLHKVTLPLVALGGFAVKEFGDQADAVTKLNAVLQAADGATGATTAHIQELAHQLQQSTRFYDDNVVAAASMLATFHKVRNEVGQGNDVFDRAIKAAAGMASITGDLEGEIFKLGRALEDPAGSLMLLRRSGIVFTEQEKFQIKTLQEHGQVLEAQRLILDKVEGKVRGVAKAMADTPFGHFVQMWNAVKDAVKPIGGILAAVLVPIADAIKFLANAFRDLPPVVQTVIVVLAALVAAIGPLLILLSSVSKIAVFLKAMIDLKAAWIALQAIGGGLKTMLLALLSPWTVVGIAVLATAAAFIYEKRVMEEAAAASAEAAKKLTDAIQGLSPEQLQHRLTGFNQVIDRYKGKVDALQQSLAEASLAQAGVSDATATNMPRPQLGKAMSPADQQAAKDQIAIWNETIARLEVYKQALVDLGVVFARTKKQINDDLVAALQQADLDLHNAQISAEALGQILGPTFNVAGARAAALEAHINTTVTAMAKAGNTVVEIAKALAAEGEELRKAKLTSALFDANDAFRQAVDTAKVFGQTLGPTFMESTALAAALRAKIDATVKSMTAAHEPIQNIVAAIKDMGAAWQIADLNAHIDEAARSLDLAGKNAQLLRNVFGGTFNMAAAQAQALRAYIDAVAAGMLAAGASVEEVTAKLKDLGAQVQELEQKAQIHDFFKSELDKTLDAFAEFTFGAKQNFGEFIRALLLDITKLILKMLLVKAIMDIVFPGLKGSGGAGTQVLGNTGGDIPFAADGGVFSSGSLAVVGEAGPELVQAGRTGMTVTPLSPSSSRAGGMGGATKITVEVNVNAIDSQDAARFFEEQQGLVAQAVSKAVQRSQALTRRLQGRG